MRSTVRNALRELYNFRCGYCGVREADAGSELTVDHFQPRARGGSNEQENLVYCCHACNEFKGDWWTLQGERRILHPLNDNIQSHVCEEADGSLGALTQTGAFHIQRLNLNRQGLISYRRERQLLQSLRAQQDDLIARVGKTEQHLQRLQAQIESLFTQSIDE